MAFGSANRPILARINRPFPRTDFGITNGKSMSAIDKAIFVNDTEFHMFMTWQHTLFPLWVRVDKVKPAFALVQGFTCFDDAMLCADCFSQPVEIPVHGDCAGGIDEGLAVVLCHAMLPPMVGWLPLKRTPQAFSTLQPIQDVAL